MPRLAEVSLDARVFAFSLLTTTLTAVVCSLPSLWQARRSTSAAWLRGVAGSGRRVTARGPRFLVVVAQVALAYNHPPSPG